MYKLSAIKMDAINYIKGILSERTRKNIEQQEKELSMLLFIVLFIIALLIILIIFLYTKNLFTIEALKIFAKRFIDEIVYLWRTKFGFVKLEDPNNEVNNEGAIGNYNLKVEIDHTQLAKRYKRKLQAYIDSCKKYERERLNLDEEIYNCLLEDDNDEPLSLDPDAILIDAGIPVSRDIEAPTGLPKPNTIAEGLKARRLSGNRQGIQCKNIKKPIRSRIPVPTNNITRQLLPGYRPIHGTYEHLNDGTSFPDCATFLMQRKLNSDVKLDKPNTKVSDD